MNDPFPTHRFLVNDTDTYVQVFFDHHLRDVTMEMFVKFEGDPNVNDYDFTDILPKGLFQFSPFVPLCKLCYTGVWS